MQYPRQPELDGYTPPELVRMCLHGFRTIGKARESTPVTTTWLKGKHGDRVVTASGSEYALGDPAPEYAALFPDPKARIFAQLRELP